MMDGELFFFAAFFFKSKQEAFPGWVIVFDLEAHHRADPREGVGQGAEKSAIAETDMREDIDRVKQRLDLAIDECRRFAFGPRKFLDLDLAGWIHGRKRLTNPIYHFVADFAEVGG